MPLPHTLLGLLSYRPATGYELKVAFEQSTIFSGTPPCPRFTAP